MQVSKIEELNMNEIEQVNGGNGLVMAVGRWAYGWALRHAGEFGDNNNGIGPKF